MNTGNNKEMPSPSGDQQPIRETRYRIRMRLEQAKIADKEEIEKKRRKRRFKRRNKIINPADIIVNQFINKIKFESAKNPESVVKQEQYGDNLDYVSDSDVTCEFEEIIVKPEIHLTTDYTDEIIINQQETGNAETQLNDSGLEGKLHDNYETASYISTANSSNGTDHQNTKNEQQAQKLEKMKQKLTSKNRIIKQLRKNRQKSTAILTQRNQNLQKLLHEQKNIAECLQKELAIKNDQLEIITEGHEESMVALQQKLEADITNWKGLFQDMAENFDKLKLELNLKNMEIEKLKNCGEINFGSSESIMHNDEQVSHNDDQILENNERIMPPLLCSDNGQNSSSQHNAITLFEQVITMYIWPIAAENKFSQVKWENHMSFLKSCRLVCKSWKETFDSLMQQDKSYQNLWNHSLEDLKLKQTKWTPPPLVLQTKDPNASPNEWITYFASLLDKGSINSSYNPVPSRHLMIEFVCGNTENSFSVHITTYLKNFGKHVWNLTVIIKHVDVVQNSRILCMVMKYLPNLKCLTIDTGTADAKYIGGSGFDRIPEYELPYLSKLTTLQCRGSMHILQHIIPRNTEHIQRLHLDQMDLSKYGIIGHKNFPNLSELSLCCYDVMELNLLRSVSWKLETLILHFPTSLKISLTCIFKVLGTFKDTLKTVVLDCPLVQFTINTKVYLDLPCVQSFNFICGDKKRYLIDHVFRYLKRIQTLHVRVAYGLDTKRKYIKNYVPTISKSIVSKFLPELKNLSVKALYIGGHP